MKKLSSTGLLIGLSLSAASLIVAPALAAEEAQASSETRDTTRTKPGRGNPNVLFETDIRPRKIDQDLIDTEDFEIGAFAGMISVEDFGSNFVWGARLAYHLSEDLFAELNYGSTTTQKTSFETLSGGATLLQDSERDLTYYNLSLGYNLLAGQAFIGSSYAFNTNFFLVAGLGSTQFAGDSRLTMNVGWGYQFLATDWLSLQLGLRDHIFNIDILGEDKTSHNLEFTSGISFFF